MADEENKTTKSTPPAAKKPAASKKKAATKKKATVKKKATAKKKAVSKKKTTTKKAASKKVTGKPISAAPPPGKAEKDKSAGSSQANSNEKISERLKDMGVMRDTSSPPPVSTSTGSSSNINFEFIMMVMVILFAVVFLAVFGEESTGVDEKPVQQVVAGPDNAEQVANTPLTGGEITNRAIPDTQEEIVEAQEEATEVAEGLEVAPPEEDTREVAETTGTTEVKNVWPKVIEAPATSGSNDEITPVTRVTPVTPVVPVVPVTPIKPLASEPVAGQQNNNQNGGPQNRRYQPVMPTPPQGMRYPPYGNYYPPNSPYWGNPPMPPQGARPEWSW